MYETAMYETKAALREEVHKLAEKAFHQQMISGYGDGEYRDEFQIVYEGKPRHFSLEYAHTFLVNLLKSRHGFER
uniref:Uncharacterized protein n=1 Tax=Cyanothece sp. (strain PCC 7425 / ATCC 29141) TaxID=395961 RepID=B8HKB4_CYAP4